MERAELYVRERKRGGTEMKRGRCNAVVEVSVKWRSDVAVAAREIFSQLKYDYTRRY